ncbi:MAG: mechanosensitive ion channel [Bacteroidales bacterium]
MEEIANLNIDSLLQMVGELATTYGIKLVLAIVVLLIGLSAIRAIVKALAKVMAKAEVNVTLVPFFKSLVSVGLKILLFISILGMVGVQMTSFIAVLGAAGLAVGLALSGTLQNFAGGVIIMLFKPYKVGDVIEAQGYLGSVKAIHIFNTVLTTGDNKTIIIPNAPISGGSLVNYSTQEKRRVDFTFGIGYNDDIDRAREVITKVLLEDERIHRDPEPFIKVAELGDSSVNFTVRVWVNTPDYWVVFFDNTEKIKKAFDRNGISIPFPQSDVHLYNHK